MAPYVARKTDRAVNCFIIERSGLKLVYHAFSHFTHKSQNTTLLDRDPQWTQNVPNVAVAGRPTRTQHEVVLIRTARTDNVSTIPNVQLFSNGGFPMHGSETIPVIPYHTLVQMYCIFNFTVIPSTSPNGWSQDRVREGQLGAVILRALYFNSQIP